MKAAPRTIGIITFLSLSTLLSSPLRAQSDSVVESDVQRMDLANRISGTTLSSQVGFAPPSPGDEDLGEQLLLTSNAGYQPFTIYGSVTEFFTTNASLVDDGRGADWFNLMQAGVNWLPQLSGNLFGEFTARQDLFRYAKYSELSFNSTNLTGGLIYVIRQLGDLSVYGRYGFTLLTNASANNQLYHEQYLKFGLQKPFILSRAHFVYTGISAHVPLGGAPSEALRDQFVGYLGYQAMLTRSVSASAFYQIGYIPFRDTGRRDWNQILSGSISYNILKYFSASASVSAAFNSSNESYFDYSVLNLGMGVSGNVQF